MNTFSDISKHVLSSNKSVCQSECYLLKKCNSCIFQLEKFEYNIMCTDLCIFYKKP